ncbi:MAG: hypothetical protein ACRDTB_12015 [Actinophytocola sp.]
MRRHTESVDCHRRALALRQEHSARLGPAHARDDQRSLILRRDIGELGDEPHALDHLGATRPLLGEPDQAIREHDLGLTHRRRTGPVRAGRAYDGRGAAHRERGDAARARRPGGTRWPSTTNWASRKPPASGPGWPNRADAGRHGPRRTSHSWTMRIPSVTISRPTRKC